VKGRVFIVGAGLMGAQVGCEYALAGHEVEFFARDPEAARARVAAALALAVRADLCSEVEAGAIERRISYAASVEVGAAESEVVIEAVDEDLALKGRLLGAAAAATPEALLATSTSSLRVTEVGELAGAPERTVGIHYLNPPLLTPVVEVVGGERTAPARLAAAFDLVAATGKQPVVVRDVKGFAWNRLQLALIRECVELVRAGIATSEEVDLVVRDGLARRWRRVGPLTTVALGGFDTWNAIGRNLLADLSTASELPDLRGFAPAIDDPAALVRRRDEGLIADLEADRG
jgi:3-hydroxybutyryl-CoA dehydrogenase